MSRKSRKKKSPLGLLVKLILLLILLVLLAFIFGDKLFEKWLPSKEVKDLNEWFEVSGDQLKIYLDGDAEQESTGLCRNGGVYLPFDYVSDELNGRFFWSESDKMLSYTLADETKDYDAAVKQNGAEAFVQEDGKLYISVDLVEEYTDLTDERFCDADETAKRIFLYHGGMETLTAGVVKNAKVRTKKDKKAPILTEVKKGGKVYVTERNDEWSRVLTEDGIAGFVKTAALEKPEAFVFPDTYEEPKIQHTLMDKRVSMAWQGVYHPDGNANFESLYANTDGGINVISPTWIQISDALGNYENYTDTEYIRKAHEAGLKVWVCVDNFNQPGGLKDFSTKTFFAAKENRRKFISKLMEDAVNYGYDGYNLDFEGLSRDAGESYIQFIRELSVECRKQGIVLSVDNYVPYGFNDFYRMDEQGVFADYVVVMLYDEHTDAAGSVASIPYTEFGIKETLKEVPADRIIAGLPLYTRLWTLENGNTKSETMGMKRAAQFLADKNITLSWDSEAGQHYGELTEGTVTQKIWMEDKESLTLKMELVEKYGLGGISMWRLGYDSGDIWSILKLKE